MNLRTVELLIPCDVYTVKVRVGPEVSLSSLERLFLEALLQGISSFEQLVHLFAIGRRPTLDLVFDLWQKGYVVLDLAQGLVLPSNQLSIDKLDNLPGGEGSEEPREVMLDLLTGQVLPTGGLGKVPQESREAMIPAGQFETSLQDVTTPQLLAALREVLANEERPRRGDADGQSRRRNKVLAVNLSPTLLSKSNQRRWLPIHLLCGRDPDSGRLQLAVAESELNADARAIAVRRLGQLLEGQPQSNLARYLEKAAREEEVESRPFEELAREIEAEVEMLSETQPGLREQRHLKLGEMASGIESVLALHRNAEAEARLVFSQKDQIDILFELVRGAERQLVIASTWILVDLVEQLLPVLRERLERGVQCFLLWGFKLDDSLSQQTRNALLEFRTRYENLFFLAHRSCREHAKLVIQDDRQALISSMSVLSPSEPRTLEVGVLLSAKDGRVCAPIEAALAWARETFPDFVTAQGLYTRFEDFWPEVRYDDDSWLDLPRPPSPPTDVNLRSERGVQESLASVSARLWQQAWADYAAAARSLSSRLGRTARVLRDGEHHDVLWHALRNVKTRLLITSDRMGPEVVNEKFVRRLRNLVEEEGVHVTLLYRRLTTLAGADRTDLASDLKVLEQNPRFRQCQIDNHSKVLVFDDTTVVSSFNFLSFYGYYAESRASQRRRQRTEVGVLIPGRELANRVLAAVEEHSPGAVGGWPSPEITEATVPMRTPPPKTAAVGLDDLLVDLSEAHDEQGQALVLREWLATLQDPWEPLERLREAELPMRLLQVAVAAAVSTHWPGEGGDDRARRWLCWLALDFWEGGRLMEAAVLATAGFGGPPELQPRPPLALLAAAQVAGRPAYLVATLAGDQGLSRDERVVVVVAALVDAALRGTFESVEVLKDYRSALPTCWLAIADTFLEYWEATFRGLPMHSINSRMRVVEFRAQVEQEFLELEEAFGRAAESAFKFASGKKTQQWLFASVGPFGRLRAVIPKRDPRSIRAWLKWTVEGGPSIGELSELIDYATAQVDPGEPIARGKRVSYEASLRAVVEAARNVAALAEVTEDEGEIYVVKRARTFASTLAQEWNSLEKETAQLPGPERTIVARAQAELQVIARWARI